MNIRDLLGPWGLLIPACAVVAQLSLDLGWLLFPDSPRRERLLGGLVWTLGSVVALLQFLFHLNVLWPSVLGTVGICTSAGVHLLRRRKRPHIGTFDDCASALRGLSFVDVVAFGAFCLLGAAVYLLPIWQWDSLGYHLPFVNFVLQGGGKAELPIDVPYLSTYPRNVELLFVALRATLPDDRLVDIGQIPLGCVAALATAGIARELGASPRAARMAGLSFLLVPAVFLQLPTNYIDVGVAGFFLLAAFFLVRPATSLNLLSAGVAVGLFLGTKPNTPPAALLLGVVLLARAWRVRRISVGGLALLLAGAIGLEAYVVQLVRHGNPVWPAIVHFGPWKLPGTISVEELLSSGVGTQKVHGPLLYRIWLSWTDLKSDPVFDMRVGGLGLLFWLALPVAVFALVRARKSGLMVGVLAAMALITPDPAVVRYILPFPALVLAAAAAGAPQVFGLLGLARVLRRRWFYLAPSLMVAAVCLIQLTGASPGLTGEGPALRDYLAMSWDERSRAVGANGRPDNFVRARRTLGLGDVAVYDRSHFLPYLMWRSDLRNRVVRVADQATKAEAIGVLEAPEVRLVAAGARLVAYEAVQDVTPPFRRLFECKESCIVYARP